MRVVAGMLCGERLHGTSVVAWRLHVYNVTRTRLLRSVRDLSTECCCGAVLGVLCVCTCGVCLCVRVRHGTTCMHGGRHAQVENVCVPNGGAVAVLTA